MPASMAAVRAYLAIFRAFSTAALSLMAFAAAFVAAQPFFDADRRLVGAVIGVGRHAFRFEQRAGIEMQHAFGAEPESVLANGGVAK